MNIVTYRQISIYAILITLAICLFYPQISHSKKQIIKAGMPEKLAPHFSISSETGKPVGFAVDVLDEISKLSDIEIQYVVFSSWTEVNEALMDGTIDMVPNMGITIERKTRMDFTRPVETITVNLFTRKSDTHLTTIHDLAGHKVGVEITSAAVHILNKEQSLEIQYFNDIHEAFFALLAGRVDAIADSFPVFMKLAIESRLDNRIKALNPPLTSIKRAIAVRKDTPELHQKLSLAVEQFIKSPQYSKIYQKWYESPLPYWTIKRITILMSALLIIVSVGLLGWHYLSLRKLNKEQQTLLSKYKQAEALLKKSKEYLDNIINSIGDPVFVKDEQFRFVLVNDALCTFLGKTRDELVGTTGIEFLPKDQMDQFLEVDKTVLSSGASKLNEESLTDGENRIRTIVTKKTRYIDAQGTKFIVGVIRDITEGKRAREEKNQLEKRLRQAQKMESVGTLAGGIAHEFNNMLAVIMGNNELIMEEIPKGSPARENTEEIRIAGMRAKDVVKQLLTFSRQDDSAKEVMDLKYVVQESMKLIRSLTPVNIKIEEKISADTSPVVGNDTQINQLLINLCNNAVDVLPEKGGVITIELLNETIDIQLTRRQTKLKPGKYAKLLVSDNGIGMETEILDRIFEPYFTTKDIGKGTGIGMAVVYGIVERHDGVILVDSEPRRGTTFTIFLPIHEGLSERETDEIDILPVGDECILYVDDEPSIAIIGKRLLESLGYTTESTTDPEIALDMIRSDRNKFDLLITDMAMPSMTGDQLIIETLKIRKNMPTIICTGYSAAISEKEAAEIGANSYIMKPINKSELATTVRKVLDSAQRFNLFDP